MIIDEDIYLEHFGVKGMKWGVRKNPRLLPGVKTSMNVGNKIGKGIKSRREGTSEQRRAGKKKFVRNLVVGTAAGVVVGAAIGHIVGKNLVKLHGAKRMSTINALSSTRKGQKAANNILKRNPQLKARALRATAAARSGPTPRQASMGHLAQLEGANKLLKSWFNENNVPIPERKYLDLSFWKKLS